MLSRFNSRAGSCASTVVNVRHELAPTPGIWDNYHGRMPLFTDECFPKTYGAAEARGLEADGGDCADFADFDLISWPRAAGMPSPSGYTITHMPPMLKRSRLN